MFARFQPVTDAAYEKYRCPVFKGFVVCVSGMASDDRNNVRSLVEQHGELSMRFVLLNVTFALAGLSCFIN